MAMSALIKSLEDIMRKDAGLNGDAQYIEQITWLLFLKAFDAKEMEWEFDPSTVAVPFQRASDGVIGRMIKKVLLAMS